MIGSNRFCTRRRSPLLAAIVMTAATAIAGLAAIAGCTESTPATKAPDLGPPQAVYTVRGVIEKLPLKNMPGSQLMVQHEAIDSFLNDAGEIVGMGAMAMEFPLGPGVHVGGLAVGDTVEIVFPVWWTKGEATWHVRSIRKLPAGLTLQMRPAAKPSQTYTVRGRVVQLLDPAKATSEFMVHHEPIPNFADETGRVVGMAEMTMPFTPGPPVRMDGLAVGDAVEIKWVVWTRPPSGEGSRPSLDALAMKVTKLPAETKLNLGADGQR